MSCEEPVFENLVERVLYAGQALGRIIVLVVYVDIVSLYRVLDVFGEHAFVNI